MRKHMHLSSIALALLLVALPAAAQTSITGAGAAAFPSGAVLENVSLTSMRFGVGVDVPGDGTATGDLAITLVGVRNMVVEGIASSGSINPALGVSTFSGTCSVDPGDGTPLRTEIPFTATIATADGASTLTLVVGTTALPAARVTSGTLRVQ